MRWANQRSHSARKNIRWPTSTGGGSAPKQYSPTRLSVRIGGSAGAAGVGGAAGRGGGIGSGGGSVFGGSLVIGNVGFNFGFGGVSCSLAHRIRLSSLTLSSFAGAGTIEAL